MADYDFTTCLSPLDFELLSKDLLEAELEIQLENFSDLCTNDDLDSMFGTLGS